MTWDKIARTGTFTDMNGNKRPLTLDIFEAIVKNYKNAREKAPAVFGHPTTLDAAQAWVADLRVNGNYLEATYEEIKPEARANLEAKKYRYKSMSYDPATNTLKHVGWLGAVPPAIGGLGEIAFAEGENELTLYYASETTGGHTHMDAEKTMEVIAEAQATVKEKEHEIDELEEKLEKAEEELKEAKEELAEAKGETEEVKAEFAKYKAEVIQTQRVKRVDALVATGRLQPSERDKVLTMAATLGANSEASFASPDGNITAEEQYLRDLEGAGQSQLFSSFSAPQSGSQPQAVSGKQMITKL